MKLNPLPIPDEKEIPSLRNINFTIKNQEQTLGL